MGGPFIDFTEGGRYRLAKYLGISHWICIIPSFICLICALYIQLIIEDKISFIESYNGAVLPGFLVFAGSVGFFAHILCGKIIFTNRVVGKREKWAKFLLAAIILTFIIFILEVIGSIMCYVHISDLGESFDKGIRNTMLVYNTDIVKKEELDLLQMSYECCGSKSYSEWFTVSWKKPNSNSRNNDVPFSCCNPAVKRPCIHHRVNDNGYHYNYDYRTGLTIHNRGCTTKLMEFYEDGVLTVIGTIILSLSFIQLVSCFAGRILQTAVIEAMNSDDPEGPSQGYLFGKEKPKVLDDTQTTDDSIEAAIATEDAPIPTEEGLDITDETTLDDTFDDVYVEPDFNQEPLYENIPPFIDNTEEHIYNEGEVEEYLAMNPIRSYERFEPPLPPPPPPLPGHEEESGYEQSPLLREVKSRAGSFMTMNRTGNSHSKSRSSSSTRVHHHPLPSPIAHDRKAGHYVIDLNPARGMLSPSRKYIPFRGSKLKRSGSKQKHDTSHRTSLLSDPSPTKSLRWSRPNIETYKVQPAQRTYTRPLYNSSPRKRTSSPIYGSMETSFRRSPERRGVPQGYRDGRVSLMFDGKHSPSKRRSRSSSASPERNTFKPGSSHGCHHGLLD